MKKSIWKATAWRFEILSSSVSQSSLLEVWPEESQIFPFPHFSLLNLVPEYECWGVFPAGVGPGSPSRNAANWLSSRLNRHGWLRMVFPGARLFRASTWCLSGGGDTREAGSAVAKNLVALYRVDTNQIRRRRRAVRWSTIQGVLNPSARESKARTGRFLRKKLISDHGLFSSYEGRQGAANVQDSWCRLQQLKASTTMNPRYFNFPYLCMMCGLEKLGLVDQN